MSIFPVDRESLIDLDVLTGFHAAATQDALIRIVAVKGIGHVLFIGLGGERNDLMPDGESPGGVMHCTIAVAVVADRAVEQVIAEDAIEGFALRGISPQRGRGNCHAIYELRSAGTDKLPVDLDHAGIACLNGAKPVVVTHLGKDGPDPVDQFDHPLSRYKLLRSAIDDYARHETLDAPRRPRLDDNPSIVDSNWQN
jgi:hypothetical protein